MLTEKAEKALFLSSIKSFREIQSTLYHVRRTFIPALPELQDKLDVNSDFFKLNNKTVVIGDKIYSDGLRVLTFSTDECLELLARANELHGDGTFKVLGFVLCSK